MPPLGSDEKLGKNPVKRCSAKKKTWKTSQVSFFFTKRDLQLDFGQRFRNKEANNQQQKKVHPKPGRNPVKTDRGRCYWLLYLILTLILTPPPPCHRLQKSQHADLIFSAFISYSFFLLLSFFFYLRPSFFFIAMWWWGGGVNFISTRCVETNFYGDPFVAPMESSSSSSGGIKKNYKIIALLSEERKRNGRGRSIPSSVGQFQRNNQ